MGLEILLCSQCLRISHLCHFFCLKNCWVCDIKRKLHGNEDFAMREYLVELVGVAFLVSFF